MNREMRTHTMKPVVEAGVPAALSVVIGTYNRLPLLRRCMESIFQQTRTPLKIYVTDAGSTDGTVAYLQQLGASDPRVTPILTGKKVGQARALNEVFPLVDTEFVCWLSDDNEVVHHGLDTAVEILRNQPRIGMVALKVKDVVGPATQEPYIGGVSSVGVLNVNQGMLRTALLQELGGFCAEYKDYGIDPDLTTRVLYAGWDVVYTREIAVRHHREWCADPDPAEVQQRHQRMQRSLEIYARKFGRLDKAGRWGWRLKQGAFFGMRILCKLIRYDIYNKPILNYNYRDWYNVFHARYIFLFDAWRYGKEPFHLVQHGKAILSNIGSRSQAPPGNALLARLCLAFRPKTESLDR